MKQRPYFCIPKDTREQVRALFDGENAVASGLAIFDSLCEFANDKEALSFQILHAWLAAKSGCSVETVKRRLAVLRENGVVQIETPALKGPCTYSIPSLSGIPPFAHSELAFAHSELALGHSELALGHKPNGPGCATLEEQGITRITGKRAKGFAPPSRSEWIEYGKALDASWLEADIAGAFDYYEANAWKQKGGNSIRNWQAACRTCRSHRASLGQLPAASAVKERVFKPV